MLGAAIASATPEVLQTLIDHLGPKTTEKALRRHSYAVIVLAGDVCRKAEYYKAMRARLTLAEVSRRREELLGDAVRFAVWKMDEPFSLVWQRIVQRSRHCAVILRNALEPTSERDIQILEEWLERHIG